MGVFDDVENAFDDSIKPHLGPLLRPHWMRRLHLIGFRVLGNNSRFSADQHGLRTLRADIDADDVLLAVFAHAHSASGLSNTLMESVELAMANAFSQSDKGNSCVTMPREVTRPRAKRSIATG